MRILLTDIDGVLVCPGGYRQSLRAATKKCLVDISLNEDAYPEEADFALLEAGGITGEWDMLPIILAVLLETITDKLPENRTYSNLRAFIQNASHRNPQEVFPNYANIFSRLGDFTGNGIPVVEGILAARDSDKICSLFPHLYATGIIRELFSSTRDIQRSWTSRLFQNYALGDKLFSTLWPSLPVFTCESYLLKYDKPLLRDHIVQRLLKLRADGHIRPVAITARPSRSTIAIENPPLGCTPEAEMALRVAGLEDLPMIGYGQLADFARSANVRVDQLLKPEPFHALAAIGLGISGNVELALRWAAEKCSLQSGSNDLQLTNSTGDNFIELSDELDIQIIEDSPIGILSALEAIELLRSGGIEVSLKIWGAAADKNKAAALERVGAVVFPDPNETFTQAMST